jgi:hypothetical protein
LRWYFVALFQPHLDLMPAASRIKIRYKMGRRDQVVV